MKNSVTNTYNTLFRAEYKRRGDGHQKSNTYPVHKKLLFEDKSIRDISHWLVKNMDIPPGAHVLDAGCGVGYTLITLCKHANCTGTGISLSGREVVYARQVAKILRLEHRCKFLEQSYDEPLPDQFDLIVAIESLKHSPAIEQTLDNLLNHLKPNGQFVIIDDFAIGKSPDFLSKPIQHYWSVPELYSLHDITAHLDAMTGISYKTIDFTGQVAFQNRRLLKVRWFFARLLTKLVNICRRNNVIGILYGGLCLERLYKMGCVEYKAVIIQKYGQRIR